VIVLDSSFLIGFYNDRDVHHAKASSLMRDFLDGRWGKGLLLEYVFLEVVAVLLVRTDLATAASVGGILPSPLSAKQSLASQTVRSRRWH